MQVRREDGPGKVAPEGGETKRRPQRKACHGEDRRLRPWCPPLLGPPTLLPLDSGDIKNLQSNSVSPCQLSRASVLGAHVPWVTS